MRQTMFVGPDGAEWTLHVPETRRERMRGLLDADGLSPRHGMLFERCRAVHTFGMRFPIDVVFLDRDLRVVDVRRLVPGRLTRPRLRARHVLECPADSGLRPGGRFTAEDRTTGPSHGAPDQDGQTSS